MITAADLTNSTAAPAADKVRSEALIIAYLCMVTLQVFLMMLSMGSGVDLQDLKQLLRRPQALILGLICQLLILPFFGFVTAQAVNLEDNLAIGLVLVVGCPSGAPATIFTLISRGDLTLSVCLTLFASILAVGTMPMNKILYIRSWSDSPVVIPYFYIAIAVVCSWVPALIGITVRYKRPLIAEKLKKVGGICAFLSLLICAGLQVVLYPWLFQTKWNEWYGALAVPILGWAVGYGLAAMFCIEIEQRRAIAFCSSFVNGALALALIAVTFNDDQDRLQQLISFPMLYLLAMIIDNLIISLSHLLYYRCNEGTTICQQRCACVRKLTANIVLEYAVRDDKSVEYSEYSRGVSNNGVVIDGMSDAPREENMKENGCGKTVL